MQTLTLSATDITAWIGGFYWPLIRVAGVLSIAPVIGSSQVPVRIRVALAFLVTLVILPLSGTAPAVDPLSADGILITLQQILIGLMMGFVLQLIFSAVTLAGENISMTMGLGFAIMSDPQNGGSVPVVGQFFKITATLLFLALDGHLALLQMLANSFSALPVALLSFDSSTLWQLIEWSSVIFRGAILIALPAVTALLATNIAMGMLTRAAPQLNIFSVGFPVTMTVGFVVIMVALPSFLPVFETLLDESFSLIGNLLGGGR